MLVSCGGPRCSFLSAPTRPANACHRHTKRLVTSCSRQQDAVQTDIEALRKALKNAIAVEDYASAARIKQQLFELEMQDPLIGLKWAMEEAIKAERYQDAARIRDQIKELEELDKPQPPDVTGLTTSSDTVTDSIRVKVRSYYVPAQSRPELGQFFFAYSVSISNEGDKLVMLASRHWVITDGTGKVDHVRGPGVIGEQPILEPGKSFAYDSACPLFTTIGTMEGEFEMVLLNEKGEWGDKFLAKIGKFALRKPETA
eukprot:GHRR01005542.1.p1 GENE.GHRR01005542.1~~GHRR01005542.1.p1  ORF type:complete len:257 (+),score=66.84 GHRR01005542.1:129-899(+)